MLEQAEGSATEEGPDLITTVNAMPVELPLLLLLLAAVLALTLAAAALALVRAKLLEALILGAFAFDVI